MTTKEEIFEKVVEYNWDKYEHPFSATVISIFFLGGGIINFIDKDYFLTSLFLFALISINVLVSIIGVCFIRRVYWRKIKND